jgi:hypothetical protein
MYVTSLIPGIFAALLTMLLKFSLSLLQKQRLVASQTRVVPIIIQQLKPFHEPTLQLCITLFDPLDSLQVTLVPTLDIRHWSSWDDVAEYKAIKATYFLADTPTNYLAIPPSLPNHDTSKPPILALREISYILPNAH